MNAQAGDHIVPTRIQVGELRAKLLRWHRRHGRSYPWRETDCPFHLLLAEMMLQRTRADQVVPVYERFIARLPTPEAVATARMRDLRRALKPLGLAWRVANFKALGQELVKRFDSTVPSTHDGLASLPGVGDYIAGAVLTIGFERPSWIVDANVVRLYRRYFGIRTSSEGRRDQHVIEIAKLYALTRRPKAATLAILDHTALVCLPRAPRCNRCPLRRQCEYFSAASAAGQGGPSSNAGRSS